MVTSHLCPIDDPQQLRKPGQCGEKQQNPMLGQQMLQNPSPPHPHQGQAICGAFLHKGE